MTISIKHAFQSAKADGGDASLVQPSNWNAEHTLTLAQDRILGRIASGAGAVEELTGANVRTIAGLATTDSPTLAGVTLADGNGLKDDAGNPVLVVAKTASAVNRLTARNAATGTAPRIEASGSDTNIDAVLQGKGTGLGRLGGTGGASSDSSGNLTQVASVNGGPLAGLRNLLINGCMRINQRAAASNADDTYAFDRWNILTQTGTVACSQQTLIENGWAHALRITQSQASAQRFGFEQIIEAANSQDLRGATVMLSARVRMSASTTLRYAILEWTGTADTVTSDVVLSWTSGTFAAGNFFLASNLTVTATGSTSLTANTAATVTLSGTLGASTNNIIVLFWTDSTQAQNVTLDIGNVQLEVGATATPFERRPIGNELHLCYRYHFASVGAHFLDSYDSVGGGYVYNYVPFPAGMRTSPTASSSISGSSNVNTGLSGALTINSRMGVLNLRGNAIGRMYGNIDDPTWTAEL